MRRSDKCVICERKPEYRLSETVHNGREFLTVCQNNGYPHLRADSLICHPCLSLLHSMQIAIEKALRCA